MNTNEFRHPKERLQNLSSRHKVSTFLFSLIWLWLCAPVRGCWRELRWERSPAGTDLRFQELSASMCVPVMCRLAVVQLTMQDWSPLGTAEALHRVCLDHESHLYDIYHNFAETGQFVQMFVSPILLFFMKLDKKYPNKQIHLEAILCVLHLVFPPICALLCKTDCGCSEKYQSKCLEVFVGACRNFAILCLRNWLIW